MASEADPSTHTPPERNRSLSGILQAVADLGAAQQSATVGDLLDELGRASGLSVMLVAAAIATTPLSGIPGLSAFCGIVIALCAGQLFFGRKTVWLPDFVRRRSVNGNRLRDAARTLRRAADFFDRHTRNRLSWLVRGPGRKLNQGICMTGGAVMPVLEFIPFSASIVGATVSLFCIALLTLDGLWAAFAFTFLAVAGSVIYVAVV